MTDESTKIDTACDCDGGDDDNAKLTPRRRKGQLYIPYIIKEFYMNVVQIIAYFSKKFWFKGEDRLFFPGGRNNLHE